MLIPEYSIECHTAFISNYAVYAVSEENSIEDRNMRFSEEISLEE